ncbi:MAG: ABC transporter ATP-binding protein [Deltaproteobacteria bacterium]|nr:ABC transporter ATP-binding protein [Deltaproteobacteria bacterium]
MEVKQNIEFVIGVENVEFGYGEGLVLKGVDLQVKLGSMVCLVGPSGSGKTTLLNVMGLLEKPQKGRLIFSGHDVATLTERELEVLRLRDLGFIFQSFFLLPTLTVLENTTYFLSSIGLTRSESRDRGEEVLKQVGLIEFKDKLPRDLSGGQRQRVAIARALAKKPRVILADEPTANLDRVTSDAIVAVFQELRRTQKVSFVFSTHDTHLVSYAQEVYRLDSGRLESGRLQAQPGASV